MEVITNSVANNCVCLRHSQNYMLMPFACFGLFLFWPVLSVKCCKYTEYLFSYSIQHLIGQNIGPCTEDKWPILGPLLQKKITVQFKCIYLPKVHLQQSVTKSDKSTFNVLFHVNLKQKIKIICCVRIHVWSPTFDHSDTNNVLLKIENQTSLNTHAHIS